MKRALILLVIVASAVLVTSSAAQDIGIVLTEVTETGLAGTTIMFDATLTNLSSSTIFLNGDSWTAVSSFLSVNDNPFLTNAPLSLAAGASSGPFELFDVVIAPGTPAGVYSLNNFTILGGLTGTDSTSVGSANFSVDVVAPVPEPATLVLVGTGLLGLGIKRQLAKGKSSMPHLP